ncbi:MAG: hypothetical protein WCE75_17880 [Terracidiphilus sp.]
MNCPACFKANADSNAFCEFCGAALPPKPAPGAAAAAASASEIAEKGKQFLASLSLGEKFVAGGVVGAVIAFFLPWFSTPDLGGLGGLFGQFGGGEMAHVSISGFGAGKLIGAVYFLLILAIGAGVLLYIGRTADVPRRLLLAGFLIMIGSLFGPALIGELLFVPFLQTIAGFGLWVLGLSFSAIAAGGLIVIATLGKTAH